MKYSIQQDRERIVQMIDERGEFVTDVDGYVYYWPSRHRDHGGHLSEHELRWIADELAQRNAKWDKQIDDFFSGKE